MRPAPPADKSPSACTLTVTPDRADCIYKRGEKGAFTTGVAIKGAPLSDAKVKWTLPNDGKNLGQTGEAKLVNGRPVGTGALDQPGFLQCRADITPPGEKLKTIRAAVAADALAIQPSLPAPVTMALLTSSPPRSSTPRAGCNSTEPAGH